MTDPDKVLEDKKNVKDNSVGMADRKIQADLESRKSKESLMDKLDKLEDSDRKVLEGFIDRMNLQKEGGEIASSEDVLKTAFCDESIYEDVMQKIIDIANSEEFNIVNAIQYKYPSSKQYQLNNKFRPEKAIANIKNKKTNTPFKKPEMPHMKETFDAIKDTLTGKNSKIQEDSMKNPSIRKVNFNSDGKPFSVNIENKSPWAHGTPSLEELQSVKDKVDVDFVLQKVNKEKT